jgi:hypothetical protein
MPLHTKQRATEELVEQWVRDLKRIGRFWSKLGP